MEHEWYDDDVKDVILYREGEAPLRTNVSFLEVEADSNCCHYTLKDLQYMANKLGGALQSVNPDEINLKFSREDIIMLAKTAGVTSEELV